MSYLGAFYALFMSMFAANRVKRTMKEQW